MNHGCPNFSCQFHQKKDRIIKDGYYHRKNDSRKISRFKCTHCKKKFSQSTFQLEYRQKKRRINHRLFLYLSSGVSQRRAARFINVDKKTVARRLRYLATKCRLKNDRFLSQFSGNQITHIQIDDLITSEHTKLKPLTVSSAICAKSRIILATSVAPIPAFGHLSKLSIRKYGRRMNFHHESLKTIFCKIRPLVCGEALIQSDKHKKYPEFIEQYFPCAKHESFESERACVTGQGELKKGKFDPLFSINHTYAMLRANINRLFRRTWCTTKSLQHLQDHLDIYTWFHNQLVLNKKPVL
jgi:transposase-like protein